MSIPLWLRPMTEAERIDSYIADCRFRGFSNAEIHRITQGASQRALKASLQQQSAAPVLLEAQTQHPLQ